MSPIVDPEVERYVERQATPPPPHLAAVAEETRSAMSSPQMLTGTVEGRLLEMIVFASGARRVLDVGTYSGYSALSMAAALPDGGRVTTCEVDPERAEVARRHIEASPHADRVEVLVGPALQTIEALDGPFDFVFIDAEKSEYPDYYEAVLPKLAERGLIAVDNTLWHGAVADERDDSDRARAMREFNDRVRDDQRVVSVILTVRDGVTLVRKTPETS